MIRKKCFRVKDGDKMILVECKNTFNLGDIVKVKSLNGLYSTYTNAIKFFGIEKYCIKIEYHLDYPLNEELSFLRLNSNFDNAESICNDNWVVVGIAAHECLDDIILCLKNSHNHYLIISNEDVEIKKPFNKNLYYGFGKFNKSYIEKIPKY